MTQDRRNDQGRSRGARSYRSGDRHGFRKSADNDRRGQRRSDRGGAHGHGNGSRFESRDDYRRGQRGQHGEHSEHGERHHRQNDRKGRTPGRGQRNGDRRDSRPPQRARFHEPVVPDNVQPADLEASARRELRALGKVNAEKVSRHLVMTQRLLSTDPELAYQHARYAASHAGRVAVVRESAGIAAYLAGHYAEALREIRAARRLSGFDMHRAIEADCERALGRLQQALKVAKEADPHQLDDLEEAELAMVVSGVRHEMGQDDLGLVVIEEAIMMFRGDRETLRRLHSVRADRLEELGRQEEAAAVRERIGQGPRQETEDDHVQVYDIEDDYDQDQAAQTGSDASARSESSSSENLPVSDEDAPVDDQGGDLREEVPAGAPLGSDRIATTGDAAAGDRDDGADSEDSDESSSFEERVEAEMAELLSDVDDTQDQEA